MKKIVLLFLYVTFFHIHSASAQNGQWTWLHGDSTTLSPGNLGTQGVASLTNEPPAFYEPCEWTDLNGNYWIYGGFLQGTGMYNDLWKYNPVTNEWTWMKGTHAVYAPGVFGTIGVSSPTNNPPALGFAAASWTDLAGNFWLFGGFGLDNYNTLWKYNVSTNEWTWMNGSNSPGAEGVYGTRGVPNIANTPGYRTECATAWTDNTGDLWLFGGTSDLDSSFNDMWRYNISSNTWTWMKGSQYCNQPGSYGTLSVENSGNTPGGRVAHTRWKDATGNLWLFGGYDQNSSGYFNDLWRFNTITNNWTWMSGSMSANALSVYGTQCTTASTNMPGAREEARAAWTDANGNLWFFGGWGYSTTEGFLNDLWMYCMATNQWTWMSGDKTSNPTGLWGTKGVSTAFTKPNARFGAVGWTDHNGHLYFFGGHAGPYNDLWKFTIDPNCSSCASSILPAVAAFQASDSVLCANDCINITDKSTNATSWQWSFPGANPSSSTIQNPQNVCYQTSGNYDVTLIAFNSGGSDTLTISNYIEVIAAPPTPSVTQSHDTLFCGTNPNYTSYQWYDSSAIIAGATDTFYVASHSGNYNIQVRNENGCGVAVGINITIDPNSVHEYGIGSSEFNVYPNPSSGEFIISFNGAINNAFVKIYNSLGEEIYSKEIYSNQEFIKSKLSSGIYFVRIMQGEKVYMGKILIE